MKKEGIDFGETLRLLAQRAGVTIPSRPEQDARKDEKERLYQVNEAAAQYFHNLLINSPSGEKAKGYVASRGFSLKTVTDFQLGFSLNNWEGLKQYLVERGYTEGELLAARPNQDEMIHREISKFVQENPEAAGRMLEGWVEGEE